MLPWLLLFAILPKQRRVLWKTSLWTMPFGLTEVLFVPEYWDPPKVFERIIPQGFDVESLIFAFGIGGVAAVLYNVFTGGAPGPVPACERFNPRHRYHHLALASPLIAFPILSLLR
jgi:hypothetical protein